MENASANRTHAAGALSRTWSRIRKSLFCVVLFALVLRLGWIVIGHTYKFKTTDNNFSFGWEMGSIAASLASGHGFSNQFGVPTGPTAWEPPLYPYLIAGVFHIFGIYSKASAFVLLTINSAFSALTCVPIFLIGKRMFSEKVAVGAVWAWALLPNVMFWCTRAVWETSLSALLLATVFWLTLTLEDRDGWLPWLEFGVLWGLIALNGTSLLSFLPAAGLWGWYRRAKRGKRSFAGVVLASMVFFACLTPWLVRNYRTFGKFIFIRDNFGAELRLGNGNGADGTLMLYLDPPHDSYAMHQFQTMGELDYIAMRKQQALSYIKADYRSLRRSFRETVPLLLGRTAARHRSLVARCRQGLAVPGIVCAFLVGISEGLEAAQAGRLADVLAGTVLSGDLLLRVCDPALPARH